MISIPANPYPFRFDPSCTAVLAIDFQRDFLEKGGFGDIQAGGNLDSLLFQPTISNALDLLQACRNVGIQIIHTREGHRPDLSDLAFTKIQRQKATPGTIHKLVIGDQGPHGRLLIRGQEFHDLVENLKPNLDELVIDKPGKGAFYNTGLDGYLHDASITHLIVIGVTTECCVTTTIREANDRGYDCCLVADCTAGFVDSWKSICLDMVTFSDGLFGFVTSTAKEVIDQLTAMAELTLDVPPPPACSAESTPFVWDGNLMDLDQLARLLRSRKLTARQIVLHSYQLAQQHNQTYPSTFIHLLSEEQIVQSIDRLEARFPDVTNLPPLYGIPFAVKDNMDVIGLETTAGCPSFGYIATQTAHCIDRLFQAGAILIGKTNMDQFAAGLTGMRSGFIHGNPSSVYSDFHISGGSSSGSGVAVGSRLVSFALGTDTAASGRIPAYCNGIVGLKPTRGSVSNRGIVPACPSLDCVSVLSNSSQSARKVWLTIRGYDALDPYSSIQSDGQRLVNRFSARFVDKCFHRFTFTIPPKSILESLCDVKILSLFYQTIDLLTTQLDGDLVFQDDDDWSPFQQAAQMLYGSALISQRHSALSQFLQQRQIHLSPKDWHPITRKVFSSSSSLNPYTSQDVFTCQSKLNHLVQLVHQSFQRQGKMIDFLLTPTIPFHPTKQYVESDPIQSSLDLGVFTQSINLLDLCAIAIPITQYPNHTFQPSGKAPFGVQLVAMPWEDGFLVSMAQRIQSKLQEFTFS